ARAALLQLGQLEDRVDRLLAGPIDEGARVDDEALGVFRDRRERKPGLGQHAEHELGIDLVLRAAERRQVDLHGWGQYTVQVRTLDATVVRELERDAEILLAQERDDLLQIVAILAGHAALVLLDGRLYPDLRILYEAGALEGEPLLQRDLLPEHAAAALLDLAVGERLQGHAALVQARLEDVDDRLQLHVVGRGHRDVGLLELHVTVGALQVVARRDLPARLIEPVGDLLHL